MATEETDLFMSVKLEDSRRLCKVSVSSQTTGQNIIELLKPDDDNVYYLVELWKGCERPIANEEKLKNVLFQWGSDIDDVVFMLKRKHSTPRQKQTRSPRNSPVQDQLQGKQQKVKNLEEELQQKGKHLKSLRNKETSKNSLRTKYVKLLESRVIEQEDKLSSLQTVQDELFRTRVDNEKLVRELERLRSMFALKHQQLAEATARVELLTRELARTTQPQDFVDGNVSTLERNKRYTTTTQADLHKKHFVNQHGQRLTEAQLLQLQANMGYPASGIYQNGQPGKDILFLKHGILQEHDDLNSLLSWQNDEENDTETSADSGHVSNDSPSYQNRLGPNFQFYPNPPEMYCAKVERFDFDQDLGEALKSNQGGVGPDARELSEVNGLSGLQQRYKSHSKPAFQPPVKSNPAPQLFVNTDFKQGGVGPFLRQQQQMNRGSPLSTSSLSSISSESSRNSISYPGKDPTKPMTDSLAKPSSGQVNINNDRFKSNQNPVENLPDAGFKKSNTGSRANTPTIEQKPFLPSETASDASARSAGSISLYHRNREGSLENSSPLQLGSFAKERTPSQTSSSSSENSSIRARTPSIEKPPVPNTLNIAKANDAKSSRLSPTVSEAGNRDKIKKQNAQIKPMDSPTANNRSIEQNGRSSPMVLNLATQSAKSPTKQNLNRKSPTITDHPISRVNDPKGYTSPGNYDSKIGSSGRVFDAGRSVDPKGQLGIFDPKADSSDRVIDSKGRTSPRVPDSGVEATVPDSLRKSEKGSLNPTPMSSPGVQEILNDMNAMKVTAREVKPIQIQTRAEKDSDNNIPVLKSSEKSASTVAKKHVYKPPKPLPRKRTKTPPARSSGSEANPAVTSSQGTTVTNSSSQGKKPATQAQNTEQKTGTSVPSEGLGTKAYDSILRSARNKGGKKSGKRVSLDPHAVLLHASLEGELELVKNIIHQVEDPSYPNNEGLTALHHAVCNSHDDIVKFLVEYGCDINASDMQGWTSLHCAAANNSIDMCKFLINNGACVFAVTAIEGKTPSRCCERESENFEKCVAYLSDMESNFGISNEGVVYAVYAYQATRKDELSFECGERLTVIRRGDVNEKEWWWARDTRNQFGYIPRNLLGLHPPVAPDV
ncbi:apoptosis-stimulating of p53 protein 1-like [Dendronephthya gigantea]|uniref:apoptosis-stimulating of p53 protein 1-like n=1 Tax=Dendronephthya gigantea TaxID=151771 RepID=UPI00106AF55E|nr:apoptosis-stimulating of p53 protein 1-like [Dendronephthya gigantea]XP_028393521.1 apoptosis-stimulating of p53 protein 1-like [Dendronephthya gigantea]